MNLKGVKVKNAKTLILGITFKENYPDIRSLLTGKEKVCSVMSKGSATILSSTLDCNI